MKPFKIAHIGDDIEDLKCPNSKCGQVAIRYVGRDPNDAAYPERPKILECQECFQRYHIDDNLKGFEYPGEPEKKRRKEEQYGY
jgi:hypothetical protein